MPKFNVEMSALTRVTCSVVVEAKDEAAAAAIADEAYNMMDGSEFTDDPDYWEHGGTYVHGPAGEDDKVEYRRSDDGKVMEVK